MRNFYLIYQKQQTLSVNSEFTLPENNEQIFASKYKTVLPSKAELKSLLDEKDSQF